MTAPEGKRRPVRDDELPEEMGFVEGVPGALGPVQDGFAAYQEACFQPRPPEFFALELCGEAGELANIEKKSWKGKDIPPEAFRDEAADVFIALVNYCNAKGVRLGDAVAEKLRSIEERRQERLRRGEAY